MSKFKVPLTELRKAKKLTQKTLAKKAGLDVRTVRRAEKGAYQSGTLASMLDALDVSAEFKLNNSEEA